MSGVGLLSLRWEVTVHLERLNAFSWWLSKMLFLSNVLRARCQGNYRFSQVFIHCGDGWSMRRSIISMLALFCFRELCAFLTSGAFAVKLRIKWSVMHVPYIDVFVLAWCLRNIFLKLPSFVQPWNDVLRRVFGCHLFALRTASFERLLTRYYSGNKANGPTCCCHQAMHLSPVDVLLSSVVIFDHQHDSFVACESRFLFKNVLADI